MASTKSSVSKRQKAKLQEEPPVEYEPIFVPTLPETIKNFANVQVKVDSEEPRYLIQYLGDVLGITDYETNLAPFWFLDTLALQLIKSKKLINNQNRTILLSWLIGELYLIQEMKATRKDFFIEMRRLFVGVSDKILRGETVPFWNLKSTASQEETKDIPKENNSVKSSEGVKRKAVKKPKSAVKKSEEIDRRKVKEDLDYQSLADPKVLLEVIIDSTYSMYGSDLRYSLVYEVFVERLEMYPYRLLVLAKVPVEPIRPEDLEKSLDGSVRSEKAKKKKPKKPKKKKGTDTPMSVPGQPPPSLADDEIITAKRGYISPLIDSQRVSSLFDTFREKETNEVEYDI